ncbi:ABC transporter transmembrane region 2-domain-containing protein [Chytridium lagenaria]|nr:ABC transporter transmembrane region 2-domain-containing protein [Chytridium lagenaria]
MLVRDLIAADPKSFLRSLGYWFLIAIPATYTNSMIKYLQSKLAINLRTELTNYVHKLYMENRTYYKAINLDNRIDGADQLITTDINRFCNALASLYSNLGKPVLDLVIFNYQLARSIGFTGTVGLAVNYMITASLMRAVTPAFGKLAAQEAKLEGDFRTAHSRLITNAEEIAFYHGGDLEKSILNRTYRALIKHINTIYNIRIAYNMFEDMIIKYSWSAVGLMIASIPVFFPNLAGSRTKMQEARIALEEPAVDVVASAGGESTVDKRTGVRTQGFITNKRLMMSLADAGGRVMYSYKELSELAGYTYRVYTLFRVLADLHDDKFVKTGSLETYSLEKLNGNLITGEGGIKFEAVPVVTPNGDTVLVRDLSFQINSGDHLMITGPNGSGKTSVVRLLSGLWPLFTGTVYRPEASLSEVVYIPQRPYLAIGSLRDQVIYPHSVEQMKAAGKTDDDLEAILKEVFLDYIPAREGGWNAVKEWKDVFSGGEKQRVQLARLFYHRPRFAILDEATSAVSTDVEALLYSRCKDAGITIVTISHRPTLFKYHQYLLRLGEGSSGEEWTFERIGSNAGLMESVEAEIKKVEAQLQGTTVLKSRLDAINKELRLNVSLGGDNKDKDMKNAKRTLV